MSLDVTTKKFFLVNGDFARKKLGWYQDLNPRPSDSCVLVRAFINFLTRICITPAAHIESQLSGVPQRPLKSHLQSPATSHRVDPIV